MINNIYNAVYFGTKAINILIINNQDIDCILLKALILIIIIYMKIKKKIKIFQKV